MAGSADVGLDGTSEVGSLPPLEGPPTVPGRVRTCFRMACDYGLDAQFAVILMLAQLTMPVSVAGPDLDLSWCRALQEFYKTRAQAGTDYVFTFGPLGLLASVTYDRDTYWLKYGWELVSSLAIAGIAVVLGRRMQTRDVRLLYYVSLLLFVAPHYDPRIMFAALGLTVLLLVLKPRVPVLVLSGLFLAVPCLVKFTCVVFALPAILLVTAWKLWETRRAKVLVLPLAYAVGLLALWLATGQTLANLPRFAAMSLEIADGYVEAMSCPGPKPVLLLSLGILVVDVLVCLDVAFRSRNRLRFAACLVLTLAALHLQFRHGFIRQDAHTLSYFAFAVMFPFFIVAVEPASLSRGRVRLGFGLTWVLAIQGVSVTDGTAYLPRRTINVAREIRARAWLLRHPLAYQTLLEEVQSAQGQVWQMPKVKATVGNRTLDMVASAQGLVFLNQLHWTPRPIFQSYSAYTPRLLDVNQDFYRGQHAPAFVLLKIIPIDKRLPMTEDGGVLLQLLRDYRPVLEERGYLLLRRQGPGMALTAPLRSTKLSFSFGEEVPIACGSDEYLTASFQLHLNSGGHLLHTLYRNPFLYLNVRLSDGICKKFRLVPGLAAHEFLLNPLVEDNAAFAELYNGKGSQRIVALSVTQEPFFGWHPYISNVQLTLKAYPASELAPSTTTKRTKNLSHESHEQIQKTQKNT